MKKVNKILIVLLLLSLIASGVLICIGTQNNKQNKASLDSVKAELDKREKDLSEANDKIEELNFTVEDINKQLSQYTSKSLFYIDETKEKTMFIATDTVCVNTKGESMESLSEGQEVTVTGVIYAFNSETTQWYEIKQDDGSQAFVSGKYLADEKPEEVKVQNPVKNTAESNSTGGKSQAQIDFEKKTQELINSGKVSTDSLKVDGVADFSHNGDPSIELH